jgi:acetyl esterase/lipase
VTSINHHDLPMPLDLDLFPVRGSEVTVLVLPGGGFREHTEHDGIGYARWLNRIGIGAAVLRYELRPDPFPLALQQARSSLSLLQRGEFADLGSSCVGVLGSSAGGLIAGLLATGTVLSLEASPKDVPRPSFQIQSYGLVDLSLIPDEAVKALLGDRPDLAYELSPINHIDNSTCRSFIWATAQDAPGLPNALALTRVLAEHAVPVELHVYPEGGHGLGLADGVVFGRHGGDRFPHTSEWTSALTEWIRVYVNKAHDS